MSEMSETFDQIADYHQATKHRFEAMARGPAQMDWFIVPNPFRRYEGAPLIELKRDEITLSEDRRPFYDEALFEGKVPPSPLNIESVSQLFFDSLAVSAWRRAGEKPWALRVNPSSGNLHPTEGYLITGPVEGLSESPMVCHYAPREHGLEVRAEFPQEIWQDLALDLPASSLLIGFASIPWRESWKYGERAFRYLHLNVGHALGAVSAASAALGWKASLLDDISTEELSALFGIKDPGSAEPEFPDCLVAVYPQGAIVERASISSKIAPKFADLSWQGAPNLLSPGHADWPRVDDAIAKTEKLRTEPFCEPYLSEIGHCESQSQPQSRSQYPNVSLRKILRQRRSAIIMDGNTNIDLETFYSILSRMIPGRKSFPFNALTWSPKVHLVLFIHRVLGLEKGLYILVRDPKEADALRSEMREDFEWSRPKGSPPGFYSLAKGDFQKLVGAISCNQKIASDGCFSLGMLARFEEPLERFGPWFYNCLLWECGMIGQALYLEAEAFDLSGCGIGCYFDDVMHDVLGLEGLEYQSLYHFTVGKAVPLRNIKSLPAYPAPG